MKKTLLIFIVALLLFACNKPSGQLVGVGANGSFKEAAPYGMVFIKKGTFVMGANDQSAIGGINDRPINVTVDAFWMDETEITNDEYKQFVNWVRDSIALRALVMGGRDEFRIVKRNQTDDLPPEIAPLNWKAKIPWNSQDEEVQDILSFMYYDGNDILNTKKEFNPGALQYRYEWLNYDQAAAPQNKYDVNTGAYPANATVRVDTSYIDEAGVIRHETITRKLKSRRDLISSKIVNVYPDTVMWIRDFQYAYNDPRMRMYFSHQGYAQYPVVGVTWEQAQAFCRWRTDYYNASHKVKAQDYRLPTEAEWEYAARGGRQMALYPWGGNYVRDNKGCYMANFKPLPGNYSDDTGSTTMKVGSFAPNDFGLFDMAGNVAEWTSSANRESSNTLVYDMNPSFQYNAKNSDPDVLKQKVVRGGSWKDIAYYLQCGTKTYEYQYESRPYIGFRCVRSYNGDL
ncbi:gliding motility-associated lipoprotein [Paludibacter sp. 221]|uniref:type IX secretion system lipoprotein PorK/GldK n=1 Tax=Paludibacter sp. 221 TaxID=2302939 RepID=UPI0013D359E2|nr:SUMF1/EgtB/PvdO family nonheme iron enzyme [Paludibacter sp. 221]NDV46345.1 gliding motility-associated lipoprotein [Paludibacter sp. 221]